MVKEDYEETLQPGEWKIFQKAYDKTRKRFDRGVAILAGKRAVEAHRAERVRLFNAKGEIVLVSFSLEIYEKDGEPRAIFTNNQPTEATDADVAFHYGREVQFGLWVPYQSDDYPDLPDPSFDSNRPIWVNVCGGFQDIEE